MEKVYIAIDLKSFYASVECCQRGLDPLTTNLVVADESRTEKTICLAVSPSLKSYGIPGRARLFEVIEKVSRINEERAAALKGDKLGEPSWDNNLVSNDPSVALGFITAKPQMAKYMETGAKINSIYHRFVAPEDIHVYSVDEVFIDATHYLNRTAGETPKKFAAKLVQEVLNETGITATCGIGTNLYLCKVAMDIVAKHIDADENGVRIAELNEESYRRELWNHKPLTDFWRVGAGIASKLEEHGIFTMGDIACCSVGKKTEYYNEDFLYKLFGVNAELLIDHAWGWEPCTIAQIKAYRPLENSISSGQVLQCAYEFEKARLVVREMTDLLVLELVDKKIVTDQMVLTVGYDIDSLTDPEISKKYSGPVVRDWYGRKVPKQAHGSINLGRYTSSTKLITEAVINLFNEIVNPALLVRRMYVVANHIAREEAIEDNCRYEQIDFFSMTDKEEQIRTEDEMLKKERRRQEAIISIRKKYGKNAMLKGMNFSEGATSKDRNGQIGGHKA